MWKEIEKESLKYRVDDHETVIVRIDGKNFSTLTKKNTTSSRSTRSLHST